MYVLLENFKPIIETVNNDISEENAESGKETSKELTNSYLYEKTLIFTYLHYFNINRFPWLKIKIPAFSLKPNTPPPDLF